MTQHDMVSCSFCGEIIKRKAKACPHCGSDDKTGWSEETYLDGIDLGDDFDYDEALEKEFSTEAKPTFGWRSWKTFVGMALLVLFLVMIFRSLF